MNHSQSQTLHKLDLDSGVIFEKQVLNPNELADLLGVSKKTIYRHVSLRGMPCLRVGKQLRFRRDTVLEWLERSSYGAPVK